MTSHYTLFEKYALRRAHPRRIVLDLIGVNWALYFLWNQAWDSALWAVVSFSLAGYYATKNVDHEKMANTTLGKLALLHLHPVNFIIHILGYIFLAQSFWQQSGKGIVAAISILLAGHLFGWKKVNDAFAIKKRVEL